jgi:hypothetical protein
MVQQRVLKIIKSKKTNQTAEQEARRQFRNKKLEYLKDKINDLATNSKNEYIRSLYRGINTFKTGFQCRSNSVNYENCDLLSDSHNISNRQKNYSVIECA